MNLTLFECIIFDQLLRPEGNMSDTRKIMVKLSRVTPETKDACEAWLVKRVGKQAFDATVNAEPARVVKPF